MYGSRHGQIDKLQIQNTKFVLLLNIAKEGGMWTAMAPLLSFIEFIKSQTCTAFKYKKTWGLC